MSHCPQCGEPIPEGARACPFCGTLLALAGPAAPAPPAGAARAAASRTIVGVAARDMAPPPPPAPPAAPAPIAGASKANRTIVGMPANALPGAAGARANARPQQAPPAGAPQLRVGNTIVGGAVPGPPMPPRLPRARRGRRLEARCSAWPAGDRAARPGRGRRAHHRGRAPAPRSAQLRAGARAGRHAGAERGHAGAAGGAGRARAGGRGRAPAPAPPHVPRAAQAAGQGGEAEDDRSSRRALAIVVTAGALALAAVLVAVFWPSAPPLTARARADAEGREGVELHCESCPDGTKVTIGGSQRDHRRAAPRWCPLPDRALGRGEPAQGRRRSPGQRPRRDGERRRQRRLPHAHRSGHAPGREALDPDRRRGRRGHHRDHRRPHDAARAAGARVENVDVTDGLHRPLRRREDAEPTASRTSSRPTAAPPSSGVAQRLGRHRAALATLVIRAGRPARDHRRPELPPRGPHHEGRRGARRRARRSPCTPTGPSRR